MIKSKTFTSIGEKLKALEFSKETTKNRGLVVDVEVSSRDPIQGRVFEITLLPFCYDDNLNITKVFKPIVEHNDTGFDKMDPWVQQLTGIQEDQIAGKSFDFDLIRAELQKADVIIAHNAEYDRFQVEREFGETEAIWLCTASDIDWKEKYFFSSRSLDYILYRHESYFEHHKSTQDCLAVLWILSNVEYMTQIFDKAYTLNVRIEVRSEFRDKDMLKSKGLFWDSNKKVWWTIRVDDEVKDLMAEIRDEVTGPVSFEEIPIDPKKRFRKTFS